MRKLYFSFFSVLTILLSASTRTTAQCLQNFDAVAAPALPAGWSAVTNVAGAGSNPWATTSTGSFNAPNAVTTNNPGAVSDEWLNSESFPINSATAVLTFRNNFNLENTFDGMVLEISIGGGAFQDILAAGGTFSTGGYNGTISSSFGNPLGGRQAWTGNSAGYILTTVNLPAAANGQNIVLRWRRATDSSVTATGATIDDVFIAGSACACTAPIISTQPANSTRCAGSNTTFTVAATGSSLAYQWQVNTGSGFGNLTNTAPYSGANTSTLTITGTPVTFNDYQYRVIITGACGNATSNAALLILNQTTHTNAIATPVVVCAPGSTLITATASGTATTGNVVVASSGTINLAIPDNTPAGTSSVIALTGATLPTAADLKLRLNIRHSWVGDLRVTLTSPCGTTLVFDRPGVPASTFGNSNNLGTSNAATPPPAIYIFDIAGATVLNETSIASGFIPAGTYKPSDASNPGFGHNWAGMTFPCGAGNWTLTLADNGGGDVGMLVDWAILKGNTYTHTLTGPGTIVQNPPTGASNANASFNVTNIPAGNQNYTLTTTDAAGCTAVSTIPVVVNALPVITFVPAAPAVCIGSIQQLAATVAPGLPQVVTGGGAITLNTAGLATPYPSNLVVTGLPTSGVTVQSIKINGFTHTFPSDLDILLQSPTGTNVILLSDHGGGTDINNISLTLDGSAATTVPNPIVAGTFRPTNIAGPDNFPAPGPGSITQVNPTFASLGTGDYNGIWKLFINDQFAGDGGSITSWEITFSMPVPITWSSATGALFTDPAATIAYTGTPTLLPVYVNPTVNTVYTASVTRLGCSSTANVTVTVNPLPAITTQPAPATQNSCPGFTVNYSVVATGSGLTYQWIKNGVNIVNGLQASGSTVVGATSANLILSGLFVADGGTYSVVVSGTCTPPVTSAGAILVVASPPTITTQPASRTVCVGQPAAFTVVVGGTPAPAIFQWQVSSDAGVTWTNINPGGFTSTYTLPSATLANSGNRYRVIVTNSCGQTVTSNGTAALTVNTVTPATVTALPARICLSDGMIPLTGSPTGGTWSGIGVSGSNFVPSATAVGTYTLTYSFINASGCAGTSTVIAKVVDDAECARIRLLRDDGIALYPNPNNGVFNIRVNSTLYNYLGMHVSTPAGQVVHKQTFTNLVFGQVIPVDLTRLPSGTYMVRMFYDDGVRTSQKTFTVVIGRP